MWARVLRELTGQAQGDGLLARHACKEYLRALPVLDFREDHVRMCSTCCLCVFIKRSFGGQINDGVHSFRSGGMHSVRPFVRSWHSPVTLGISCVSTMR